MSKTKKITEDERFDTPTTDTNTEDKPLSSSDNTTPQAAMDAPKVVVHEEGAEVTFKNKMLTNQIYTLEGHVELNIPDKYIAQVMIIRR